jgi:predicted kinase
MKLYMLIGLPGVGKSTWARERYSDHCIFSSDNYRRHLFDDVNDQSHNADVFAALYRDMDDMFRAQYPSEVVFDATNLNAKRRKHVIDLAHRYGVEVEAVVFVAPLDVILQRNSERDRVVPEDSIRMKYRTFHVPLVTEGFDGVAYANLEPKSGVYGNDLLKNPNQAIQFYADSRLGDMHEFDQRNPHHTLDLWTHTLKVYTHLRKHGADYRLQLAALYHDIGKLDTQTFDDNGVAHYYGHQYVSTQLAIQELFGAIAESDLLYITTLIHYHMDVYNCKTAVDTAKLARRLGNAQLFNDLIILHEADVAAH